MGAHLLTEEEADALARVRLRLRRAQVNMAALGQQAPELAAPRRVRRRARRPRCCSRRCPPTSSELAAHPLVQEKLMPVLGLVRSPSVEHAHRRRGPGHRARRARAHLRGLRQRRRRSSTPTPAAVRTGRILVNAPTAVGALGGVYNNLTPTFSLGCGTWGGSSTTENVNYQPAAQHQDRLPPADARRSGSGCPSNTLFNAGALENLRDVELRDARSSSPTPTASGAGSSTWCASKLRTRHVQVFSEVEPEPDEAIDPRRRRAARPGPPGPARRRRRRLGHRRGQGDAALPRAPREDAWTT